MYKALLKPSLMLSSRYMKLLDEVSTFSLDHRSRDRDSLKPFSVCSWQILCKMKKKEVKLPDEVRPTGTLNRI